MKTRVTELYSVYERPASPLSNLIFKAKGTYPPRFPFRTAEPQACSAAETGQSGHVHPTVNLKPPDSAWRRGQSHECSEGPPGAIYPPEEEPTSSSGVETAHHEVTSCYRETGVRDEGRRWACAGVASVGGEDRRRHMPRWAVMQTALPSRGKQRAEASVGTISLGTGTEVGPHAVRGSRPKSGPRGNRGLVGATG